MKHGYSIKYLVKYGNTSHTYTFSERCPTLQGAKDVAPGKQKSLELGNVLVLDVICY